VEPEEFTTAAVDYLQRTGPGPPPVDHRTPSTRSPAELRRLLRIRGVGRFEKNPPPQPREPVLVITEDLLIGLYNYKIPVALEVACGDLSLTISIGTWLPEGGSPTAIDENTGILAAALSSLYPAVDLTEATPAAGNWSHAGFALGIPSAKQPEAFDGRMAMDRLLRAQGGGHWHVLILAQPVDEAVTRDLRLQILNEVRAVTGAAAGTGLRPAGEHYVGLLQVLLGNLTLAQGAGAWRTAVYLAGDPSAYYRLASLWRGIFSGPSSSPEPVRVFDLPAVAALTSAWALPDTVQAPDPPGHYGHPFVHQTLLTSTQLAAYVHLPEFETAGFAVRLVPDFDAVPPAPSGGRVIEVGTVLERGRPTGTDFALNLDRLTRHAFVTGVTGSGKTNTVFHLLRRASSLGVPFLVIEPAKTEYRVLLRDQELADHLQVFTLGDEATSPFRLNPFEVPEGLSVATHLDLLRSVFHVSFGMWTPLPQVLEICLHRIYADRGWDLTTNQNRRLGEGSDRSAAFPSLSDLVAKVDEVTEELGYEDTITADLRAALRTRLNSLLTGGKGRMLGARESLPIELLLDRPTILELEGMGDDDDKAFAMGLVMIRLAEQRRLQGDLEALRHLLVIEEAHRLLANSGSLGGEGEADVRGKAVETFTNLLSEIRAYGQGVIVVDQIPANLSPDVVKNTNLKLAHRIVAGDDRATLAAAMAMSPRQETSLATLAVGQAAVFTDGEDAPLLLLVPRAKGGSKTWPSDAEVGEAMGRREELRSLGRLYRASPDCDDSCLQSPAACDLARRLTGDEEVIRTFSRTVLSAIQTPGGAGRTWPDLVAIVESRRPSWIEAEPLLEGVVTHASARLASHRGAQAGWTYGDTEQLGLAMRRLGRAQVSGDDSLREERVLRELFIRLQGPGYGPFLACHRIWDGRDGPCLCRYPVADLIGGEAYDDLWLEAEGADRASEEGGREATWTVCQDAAFQLVEFPLEGQGSELIERLADMARCTALCFAQQLMAAQPWSHPRTQKRALDGLIDEAGHE
jgi:hypothetical protein